MRDGARDRVKAPGIGSCHTVRLVAIGAHRAARLGGTLSLDHRDARVKAGRAGLWTKAGSIAGFDDLTARGVSGGSS
jgi:hypothetical protein